MENHQHYVQGVAWDPLGHYVCSQSNDRTCKVGVHVCTRVHARGLACVHALSHGYGCMCCGVSWVRACTVTRVWLHVLWCLMGACMHTTPAHVRPGGEVLTAPAPCCTGVRPQATGCGQKGLAGAHQLRGGAARVCSRCQHKQARVHRWVTSPCSVRGSLECDACAACDPARHPVMCTHAAAHWPMA